jgi:hypothetical protein
MSKGKRGKGEAYNSVSSLGLTIVIRLKQQFESTMRAIASQYRESASLAQSVYRFNAV